MTDITKFLERVALKLRPVGVIATVVVVCLSLWLVVSGGLFSLGMPGTLGLMWLGGIAVLYTSYFPGEPFARQVEERGISAVRKAPDWAEGLYGLIMVVWFVGLILFTAGELWA